MLDTANPVRQGEELDHQAVTQWLQAQGIDLQGTPEVTQFSGGASNWTYRLQYANRDLILRRPPKGTKAKSAHDMVREYNVQNALKSQYPLVPTMVALCTDEAVIGCDFYVMEKHRLGNIKDGFAALAKKRKAGELVCQSRNVPEKCIKCEFYTICKNGCLRERNNNGINELCKGYQQFFAHALPRLEQLI